MASRWWALTAVCVGTFMLLLDITIVNVALPDIQIAFRASLADLQWVVDAYALVLAALLLTSGVLADRLGRRRVFAVGLVIFTAGSLLCGLATNALFLELARAFQGIGGSVMFATGLALIAQAFPFSERGTAFGIFGAVTGVAIAVGPVLGGVLTSGLSWRWIFFVNVPIGIAAIAVTLTRVEESRNPHAGRPDWFGFVSFSGALALLVYALIKTTTTSWSQPVVIGCLTAAAVLMAAFVLIESRIESPMFDLGLLRKPTFSGGLVAAFVISASLFSLLTYLVLYLQDVLHLSAVATGVRFLVLTGAVFIVAAVAGRLTTRIPIRAIVTPGFLFVGAGLLAMRGITPASPWTHLVPGFLLSGIGAGLVNVPLASTAVGVVPPQRAGMASGVNSTFRQVGIAAGVAALGSVFSSRVRHDITAGLAHTRLHAAAASIANAVTSGERPTAPHGAPASLQRTVAAVARAGFVHALNEILLIGAVLAFLAAATSLVLIRQRDFVTTGHSPEAPPAEVPGEVPGESVPAGAPAPRG